jgi:hypothetical protein
MGTPEGRVRTVGRMVTTTAFLTAWAAAMALRTGSLENPVKRRFVCVWTRLIPIRSGPGTPARPARCIHVLYGTPVALPIAAHLVHSRLSPHLPPISLVASSYLDYSPSAIVSSCTWPPFSLTVQGITCIFNSCALAIMACVVNGIESNAPIEGDNISALILCAASAILTSMEGPGRSPIRIPACQGDVVPFSAATVPL